MEVRLKFRDAIVAIMTLTAGFGAVAAASRQEAPCSDARVQYETAGKDSLANISLKYIDDSKGSFPGGMSAAIAAPDLTRSYRRLNPDTMKAGPWSTVIYAYEAGQTAPFLKVKISNHVGGGVIVNWLNEKLLHLAVFWGRIGSTDLILDVEKREWLYAEDANHGALTDPCRE